MFKLNGLKEILYVHKDNMDIFFRSIGIENGGQY